MEDYACSAKQLGANNRSTMMIRKPVDHCRGQMNNSQKKFTSTINYFIDGKPNNVIFRTHRTPKL